MITLATALAKSRAAIALALIAWCAGAGCIAVSYAREHRDAQVTPLKTKGFAGLSGSGGASCHHHQQVATRTSHRTARQRDVAWSEEPARSEVSSCCPLMSASFVTASANHRDDGPTAALARGDFNFQSQDAWRPPATSAQLRLPDRDQTYLRVCSFLI